MLVIEMFALGVGAVVYFSDRVLPGVRVAGINIGGRRIAEAGKILNENAAVDGERVIRVKFGAQTWQRSVSELGIKYLPEQTVNRAMAVGRKNVVLEMRKLFAGVSVPWVYSGQEGIDKLVDEVAQATNIPAVEPQLKVEKAGAKKSVVVLAGSPGRELDQERLKMEIVAAVDSRGNPEIGALLVSVNPQLSDEEVLVNQARANNLVGSKIRLVLDQDEREVGGETLLTFLEFPAGYQEEKIMAWAGELAKTVNREPQNALFNFAYGRVQAFKPAKDGVAVNERGLANLIIDKLSLLTEKSGEGGITIPVSRTAPEITTDKVNELGIKELIGVGKSKFSGSIANRVHNLSLAAARLNGTLVAPGETFSFNKTVGEISGQTGYKEAYVIQQGRTVLGDGGGVCQVSTTLFRSVMNAGLPVEERKAHAYRVHYYEEDSKPGLDATVFAPSTDFKFKNDTPGHILIQTSVDKKNLAMTIELYGSNDGRVSEVSTPVVSSQTPPPPDQYQDDPTLPRGVIKQVDWSAWGARVTFRYKVTRNGEVLTDRVFNSNFRAWQAVYLRGTGGI